MKIGSNMYSVVAWTSAGSIWLTALWNNADEYSGQEPPCGIWELDSAFACWCQINWCAPSQLLVKLFIFAIGERKWPEDGLDFAIYNCLSWHHINRLTARALCFSPLSPKLIVCGNSVVIKYMHFEVSVPGSGRILDQSHSSSLSVPRYWILGLSFLLCKRLLLMLPNSWGRKK